MGHFPILTYKVVHLETEQQTLEKPSASIPKKGLCEGQQTTQNPCRGYSYPLCESTTQRLLEKEENVAKGRTALPGELTTGSLSPAALLTCTACIEISVFQTPSSMLWHIIFVVTTMEMSFAGFQCSVSTSGKTQRLN